MEIVKTSENKESVYELVYEENTIKELISEIITNCSIRVRGRYRVEAKTLEEAEDKINASIDLIGNKVYENVSDIRGEEVYDTFDYCFLPIHVSYIFEADALVSPKLVEFLNKLLSDEEITFREYELFKERKEVFRKDELNHELKAGNSFVLTRLRIAFLPILKISIASFNV